MKKTHRTLLSILLALTLLASLPMTALAEEDVNTTDGVTLEQNYDKNTGDNVTVDTDVTVGTNTGDNVTNNGTINTNEGTITNNGTEDGSTDSGTVDTNNGKIENNYGTVGKKDNNGNVGEGSGNSGTITTNEGNVLANLADGTIEVNNGTVGEKDEFGTRPSNSGNYGKIESNTGTVITNDGEIGQNSGIVDLNEGQAVVHDNSGTVTSNYGGTVDNVKGGKVDYNSGLVNNAAGGVVDVNFGTVENQAGGVVLENKDTVENQAGGLLNDVIMTLNSEGTGLNFEYQQFEGKAGTYVGTDVFVGSIETTDETTGEKTYSDFEDGGIAGVLKQTIRDTMLNLKDLGKLFQKDDYEVIGYQEYNLHSEAGSSDDKPVVYQTMYKVTDPDNWLTLIWQKIVRKPVASPAGDEAVPTSYDPNYIGLGSVIFINEKGYKVVEIKDDAYVVVTFDALPDEDVADLNALFDKLFTPEQQKLIKNIGQLLDSEDVLTIFGKPGNHPVFEFQKDLVK